MGSSSDLPDAGQLAGAVSQWVRSTADVLRDVQHVLEVVQFGTTAIPIDLVPKDLLPRVRECRAQAPTVEGVRAWLDVMKRDKEQDKTD